MLTSTGREWKATWSASDTCQKGGGGVGSDGGGLHKKFI